MTRAAGILSCGALTGVLMAATAGAEQAPASSDAERQELTVSYVLTTPTLSLHEPVLVDFSITNLGPAPVKANLGRGFNGYFVVTVTTPSGQTTDPLRLMQRGAAVLGVLSIPPGGNERGTLVLNEWYAFNEIGTYRIGLELEGEFKTAGGAEVNALTTATIQVEVTATDPERLRLTAEKLAAAVLAAKSVRAAFTAARALTYVDDPIGAQSCRDVLSRTTRADIILIDGLSKMSNGEAREVLANLAGGQGERALLAKSALERMALPSSPELR
jgi:hypothetical protein